MQIIDIDGKPLVITDLEKAIRQADDYRFHSHEYPQFYAHDILSRGYWQDAYEKLLHLKESISKSITHLQSI